MIKLGKIEKITDLRSVWPHEAIHFSKWLSQKDNLCLLSEAIGIDIVLEELESSVGSFSVDLFASEAGTNRKIIIENQLEATDHDHLGKIITYASGKNAEVIIWLVKRARDEHKQAIEWLNQHTDEQIGFFLVEIELWKINDSLPAVKFNTVERPNDWAKSMKATEGLSDTRKLQLEFWQAFNEYALEKQAFNRVFSQRKPQAQSWYELSVGSSVYRLGLFINTQKKKQGAEIYISNDKQMFDKFKAHKESIESELGFSLEWSEAIKDCRIFVSKDADIKENTDNWSEYYDWYCHMALTLREILKKYDV
ncbi:MAG: DUF4268 domain-containing protein [Culicoidibacterales bacterium]